MISKEEDKIIVNFLVNKRLSYDLMSEVYDHMTTQIHELKTNENMSFEEAWQKVQFTWIDELKMTYDVRFSLDDISVLSKRIMSQRNRQLWPKAVGIGVGLALLLLLLFAFAPNSWVVPVQVTFCISILAMVVFFLVRLNQLKRQNAKLSKDSNFLTQFEGFMAIPASLGGFVGIFASSERWIEIHNLLQVVVNKFSSLTGSNYGLLALSFVALSLYCTLLAMSYLGFIGHRKYYQQALSFKKKVEEVLI